MMWGGGEVRKANREKFHHMCAWKSPSAAARHQGAVERAFS